MSVNLEHLSVSYKGATVITHSHSFLQCSFMITFMLRHTFKFLHIFNVFFVSVLITFAML